ncbi:MAG TPA: resolvase [Lachnospiraceae bacterium]|nr:resolvase [Lachnospiraceae bacterium]
MSREKNRIYRTAAYIRLSREDGDKEESDSITNQRKLLDRYIERAPDLCLQDYYIDDGFTGTHFRRPAFLRMLRALDDGIADCVLVKDLSRFGRDYIDAGKYLERYFPDRGIRFIAVSDAIDSLKSSYDILLPIKNIFNEQYARDISKKVHASIDTKQRAGEFIGAFCAYGYRKSPSCKNRLIPDPCAAAVVRRIFTLYAEGTGKQTIARLLNDEGIPCPSEYKRQHGQLYRNGRRLDSTVYWTYSTVNKILHSQVYIGNTVQGIKTQQLKGKQRTRDREEWIVVPHTHEPILEPALWEKAQALLKRSAPRPVFGAAPGLFAGFLVCGDCGRSMAKKSGSSLHGTLPDYCCGTYTRHGRRHCSIHRISGQILEKILLADLNTVLGQIRDLPSLVRQTLAEQPPLPPPCENDFLSRRRELEKLRELKLALYEDYRAGLLTAGEYTDYKASYNKKEKSLQQELQLLSSSEATGPENPSPWIRALLAHRQFDRLDRSILADMVEHIQVYEDHRILIAYTFTPLKPPVSAALPGV